MIAFIFVCRWWKEELSVVLAKPSMMISVLAFLSQDVEKRCALRW